MLWMFLQPVFMHLHPIVKNWFKWSIYVCNIDISFPRSSHPALVTVHPAFGQQPKLGDGLRKNYTNLVLAWLDGIRESIWIRISEPSDFMPSTEALRLHWYRSVWILHMWKQAPSSDYSTSHAQIWMEGQQWLHVGHWVQHTAGTSTCSLPDKWVWMCYQGLWDKTMWLQQKPPKMWSGVVQLVVPVHQRNW